MKSFKKKNKKTTIPGTFKHKKAGKTPPQQPTKDLQDQVNLLREQLNSLKEDVRPFLLERDAINESKDRFLISCDASWTKTGAAIAYVMRSITFKEPIRGTRPVASKTSNEAELDALYAALNEVASLYIHNITKDKRVKYIEIRSDSQLCINWITGKRNCYIEKIKTKINIIRELVKGIEGLSGKSIKLAWRRRNSTYDLGIANDLAQETTGTKVH